MRGIEFLEKINDIDDKVIEQASVGTKHKKISYIKWGFIAACFIFSIITMPFLFNVLQEKDGAPYEVVIELNAKLYSVVYTDNSPAYKNYDLEKDITPDLVGEYLGEYETSIDNDKRDIFKIYRYQKCEVTEYDWAPRLIVEDSKGAFYHALIGSVFNPEIQTSQEFFTVYGIYSANDIISISNQRGVEISDPNFIREFYDGLFTKATYGNDKMQEIIYQNTDIKEEEISKLYSKYSDDSVRLKVKLKNGLVIGVIFTSHNFVEVDNGLYFRVDDAWLVLVSVF